MSDMIFDPMNDVIEAFRNGEMVVVTDDEGRENEGDLICSAEKVTPEVINFMITHAKGLVCAPITQERATQLGLRRMNASHEGDKYQTAFTVTVDAAKSTTGISAAERADTIKVLVDGDAKPDDLLCPGHVFPLVAMDGGVLERPGHTEATIDLNRMAGFKPAGVICEITNEDGTMARMPQLCEFAKKHGLKMTSVAEIIRHRYLTEKLVECERTVPLPTEYGEFKLSLFTSDVDEKPHLALVCGEPAADKPYPLVRVHSECLTGDVFGSLRCDCGPQIQTAMKMVQEYGYGAVVYMRQEGRGIGLAKKIHAYELQDQGYDTVEANEHLGFDADLRDYGIGAQILKELGMDKIRMLTNNPAKIEGLDKYGVEVVERVPLILESCEYNERYLNTKKEKMRHMM